jgi:S-adenosylmethionine hydrolase
LISHAIPAGNILQAAVTLWQAVPYFPRSTIFLAVVDPGVGTSRKPIVRQANPGKQPAPTFIGPDNGLFSLVAGPDYLTWELSNPNLALLNPGMTFHGRDIFAPAAAHIALGIPGSQFGRFVESPVALPLPRLELARPGELEGQILYADHFGNLLPSLGKFNLDLAENLCLSPWLPGRPEDYFPLSQTRLELINGERLSFAATFAEIPEGKCAFIIGSSGLLEIAANQHSAAELLGLKTGDPVSLKMVSVQSK